MSAQIDAPKYTYLKRGVYYFLFSLLGCVQITHAGNWNKSSSDEEASGSGKINTYGGSGYINEGENPNFETLRWSLYRKIHYRPLKADRFHSVEGVDSYEFEKDLRSDNYIKKQMKISPLLSYLLYEDGKITIDELTPEDRFGDMFSDTTMYHSMSMGKSITSYLVGHAICDGTIDGLDAQLDDWPILVGTLYHQQKLINFLNMATGDKLPNFIYESDKSIQARMATEFQGTTKTSASYHYTNLNTNIVNSYLLFKYGEQGFKDFLNEVFTKKIKIQHEVQLNKSLNAKAYEQSLGHQFFATRYDYLRIAVSMLNDWQEDTCVGQYLKSIHSNRIPKNGAQGNRGRVGLPQSYGGQFHTGYKGMKNRPVMGMDGSGGQTILIDFERGRIIATLSVFDNMSFPKSGAYDFKKISYEKIKNGKPSATTSVSLAKLVALDGDVLKKNNLIRREKAKKEKAYWDKHYDKIFFGDKVSGATLLSENFENQKLSVADYDNNWGVEKEFSGNSVYCNKVKDSWTEFNFGSNRWSDYSIAFKMKLVSDDWESKVETHLRMTKQGRHTITIKKSGTTAMIHAINKSFSTDVPANDWLDIKLTAVDSEVKTYINGEIATSSDNAFWEKGAAMIAVSKNSKLCVDDIVVKKM